MSNGSLYVDRWRHHFKMLRPNTDPVEAKVIPLHSFLRWPYEIMVSILARGSSKAPIARSAVCCANPKPARTKSRSVFRNRAVAVNLGPESTHDTQRFWRAKRPISTLSCIMHSTKTPLYLWTTASFNLARAVINLRPWCSRAAALPSSVVKDAVSFITLAWPSTVLDRAVKTTGIRCRAASQWVSMPLPSQPVAVTKAFSQVGPATAFNGTGGHH